MGKAQCIVNAVLAYQGREQAGEPLLMGHVPDYELIRSFVLQVIEEHEGQKKRMEDVAEIPENGKTGEVSEDMGFAVEAG